MRSQSALSFLYTSIVTFFAAFATVGVYGAITVTGGGTASVSAGSTSPASDYDARVKFTQGGTVGTPGIQYAWSLDGGLTYSMPVDLGTNTTIEVGPNASQTTITLGAGTVITNQLVSFETEGPRKTANVVVGWREKVMQTNQGPGGANRVCLQPGEDSGKDGEIVGVRGPGPHIYVDPPTDNTTTAEGTQMRRLADWNEIVMISIWGADPARPRDDLPSIEACVRLLEDVMQAVVRSYPGQFVFGTPSWTTKTVDTQYGRELRIPLAVRATFFDLPEQLVSPTPAVARPPATPPP